MKVAVIGGGIAGLGAAIALERIGVDAEIFERSASIREIGAGLSLWPNATFALRELGLLEPCARAASRVRRIGLMDPGGREWASVDISGHATPALCLDRPALLSVLLAVVDPERIHVSQGCEGVSLESQGGRKPRVHLEDGRTLEFDAVIGADGMGSVVRRFVTGRVERPVYRGYLIWRGVADTLPPAYAAGDITEAWGKGERFGIMPIGDGKVCWYVTRNQPDTAPPQGKAEILERFRGWHPPIAEVVAATRESAIVRTPALDRPTTWRSRMLSCFPVSSQDAARSRRRSAVSRSSGAPASPRSYSVPAGSAGSLSPRAGQPGWRATDFPVSSCRRPSRGPSMRSTTTGPDRSPAG